MGVWHRRRRRRHRRRQRRRRRWRFLASPRAAIAWRFRASLAASSGPWRRFPGIEISGKVALRLGQRLGVRFFLALDFPGIAATKNDQILRLCRQTLVKMRLVFIVVKAMNMLGCQTCLTFKSKFSRAATVRLSNDRFYSTASGRRFDHHFLHKYCLGNMFNRRREHIWGTYL